MAVSREQAVLELVLEFAGFLKESEEAQRRYKALVEAMSRATEQADIDRLEREAVGAREELDRLGRAGQEQLGRLAKAAGQAAEGVKTLGAGGRTAADVLIERFRALAGAVEEVLEAERSGDHERFEESLRRLADNARDLEPQLRAAFETGEISAEQYAEALRQVTDAQIFVESSTADAARSFVAARDAMESLDQRIQQGSPVSARALAQVRLEVDAYREALERAKAEGRTIGEGEQAQLRELEARYDSAVSTVGRYRAAQQQAKEETERATIAAGEQTRQIRTLDDAVKLAVPGWARYVGAVTAVIGVFDSAYSAGTRFRNTVNELTGGALDRLIQNTTPAIIAARALAGEFSRIGFTAEQTERQMEILRRNGIDPTGLSAEQVAAKILELGAGILATRQEAVEAERAYQQQAEALGLTTSKIDEASRSLAAFVQQARERGEIIPPGVIADFKAKIQEYLDGYERVGKEAPTWLKPLVEEWGVLSTAQQKAAEEAKKAGESFGGTADEAERLADSLIAAAAAQDELTASQARIPATRFSADLELDEAAIGEELAAVQARLSELRSGLLIDPAEEQALLEREGDLLIDLSRAQRAWEQVQVDSNRAQGESIDLGEEHTRVLRDLGLLTDDWAAGMGLSADQLQRVNDRLADSLISTGLLFDNVDDAATVTLPALDEAFLRSAEESGALDASLEGIAERLLVTAGNAEQQGQALQAAGEQAAAGQREAAEETRTAGEEIEAQKKATEALLSAWTQYVEAVKRDGPAIKEAWAGIRVEAAGAAAECERLAACSGAR